MNHSLAAELKCHVMGLLHVIQLLRVIPALSVVLRMSVQFQQLAIAFCSDQLAVIFPHKANKLIPGPANLVRIGGDFQYIRIRHIRLFVDCPQTAAPCDIARTLKSISAIELFRIYPKLKQFYARCGALWSGGYFISTVGHISETTVKQYIEEQKSHG